MNINDVKDVNEKSKNHWSDIFNKQRELAHKYADIEGMGDLLQRKNNIQTAFGQKWIKDFAWRFVEELTESEEAFRSLDKINEDSEKFDLVEMHRIEEMIDALHFLTELTIIAGYDQKLFINHKLDKEEIIFEEQDIWRNIIYNLGCMCNCLKNKPWKQTQMMTDEEKFKKYLQKTWIHFLEYLFYELTLTKDDIYNFYFKKNEVNKFRIRSKY